MTVCEAILDGPLYGDVVRLFDDYREHYGHAAGRELTDRWLRDQQSRGRLHVAVAVVDGSAAGLVTGMIVPASLTLRDVWLIRDVYVAPAYRRRGVARALVAYVAEMASAAGALRLALQTEPDNAAALTVYAEAGFEPVAGLVTLSRPLP